MTITIYTKMTLFSNCPNSSSKFLFSLLNIYFFKFSLYKSSTVIHQAIYQTINKSKKYLEYIDIYLSPVLSTVPHLLQEKTFSVKYSTARSRHKFICRYRLTTAWARTTISIQSAIRNKIFTVIRSDKKNK